MHKRTGEIGPDEQSSCFLKPTHVVGQKVSLIAVIVEPLVRSGAAHDDVSVVSGGFVVRHGIPAKAQD